MDTRGIISLDKQRSLIHLPLGQLFLFDFKMVWICNEVSLSAPWKMHTCRYFTWPIVLYHVPYQIRSLNYLNYNENAMRSNDWNLEILLLRNLKLTGSPFSFCLLTTIDKLKLKLERRLFISKFILHIWLLKKVTFSRYKKLDGALIHDTDMIN